MALVDVEEVKVVGVNPARFSAAYQFEITFECIEELSDDLEWRIVYVGSAGDEEQDQVLEEVMVGPVPLGTSKFVLEAPAPDWARIPRVDRLGVTVLNVCCAYKGQPFVNVGYYVNNEYYANEGPEDGGTPSFEDLPEIIDEEHVYRNVMSEEPRVTRYNIKWHLKPGEEPPPTPTRMLRPGDDEDDLIEDDDDDDDEEEDEDALDDDEDLDEEDQEDDREVDLRDEDDDEDDDAPSNKRQRTDAGDELDDDDDDDDEQNDQGEVAAPNNDQDQFEEEDEPNDDFGEEDDDEEEEEEDDDEEP